ncbi:MAG TPA: glycosyltransferase [Gemmatimonadales bacterium]
MHIALYTHSRLPVEGYGGTQRVVVWLARGLTELGHRVTLLAPAGSRVAGAQIVPLDPREIARPGFDLTPLLPASVEILHAHGPLRTAPDHPHVFTLHGNYGPGRGPLPNTIFVSADHARRHGGTAFVYNGADPSEFVFRPEKADFDLFLGRLHTVKGYRWAIQGAKRSGRPIVVAGGWRLSLSRRVRFVGSVDGERKTALLSGARCLWMPALWDEPFGLTLVEAMMSGTPVLGTRRGALPEVVSNEVGALGDSLDELVTLRSSIERCDPHACRRRAERWFSHTAMAEEYVRMYRHYLAANGLPEGRLTTAPP